MDDHAVQRIRAIFDDIYRLAAWVSSGETEEERIARGNEVMRTFDGYAEEVMGLLPTDKKEDRNDQHTQPHNAHPSPARDNG